MTFRPSPTSAARCALLLVALAVGCVESRETTDAATLAAPPAGAGAAAAAMAVAAVGNAAGLAIAGRQTRDPELLVQAAEAIVALRSREEVAGESADPDAPGSLSPAALVQEAESTGAVDAALAERIAAVRAMLSESSGAEGGPRRYSASVAGRSHRRHELYFDGAAPAVIQVRGSGTTNLDVVLYDVNGDRVADDDGPSDVATVHWYVPYTQTLTLVVHNGGRRSNGYYVITN